MRRLTTFIGIYMEYLSHQVSRVFKSSFYHGSTELCVMCNVDTKVPKGQCIEFRTFYIEGSGQLCEKCWNVVYKNVQ